MTAPATYIAHDDVPQRAPTDAEACALTLPAPFTSEEPFWRTYTAYFHLLIQLRQLEETARSDRQALARPSWFAALPEGGPPTARVNRARKRLDRSIASHRDQVAVQRSALEASLAASPNAYPAPRMIRLARRIGLSPVEFDVMAFLVLHFADACFTTTERTLEPRVDELARLFELSPEQYLSLARKDSALRAHGLIDSDDGSFLYGWRRAEVKVDRITAKVLRGLRCTQEELFPLGDGIVRRILADEPGYALPAAAEGMSDVAVPLAVVSGADRAPVEPEFNHGIEDLAIGEAGPMDLDAFLRSAQMESVTPAPSRAVDLPEGEVTPFGSDLEYLEEHLTFFAELVRASRLASDDDSSSLLRRGKEGEMSKGASLREAQMRVNVLQGQLRERLERTRCAGLWRPRAEQLAKAFGLCDFERNVLLLAVGWSATPQFRRALSSGNTLRGMSLSVGDVLCTFFDVLEDQVKGRRYFYADAPLVKEGLIVMSGLFSDVNTADISVDRRILDFLLGIDSTADAVVEGSHLYTPSIDLDRVILPAEDKRLLLETVENFPSFQLQRRKIGMEEQFGYGTGIVILLEGESGTGKTMFVNGIGTRLRKRILLANFSKLSPEGLRFLFREAKINDAILFFDEGEGIFQSRKYNDMTGMILSELERFAGICFIATNRPQEIDEAMHDRITLTMHFRLPDPAQREAIWRAHVPTDLEIEGDIDYRALAFDFELSGRGIKSAWLVALSIAIGRDPKRPVLTNDDLREAARRKLMGRLQLISANEAVTPTRGLDTLVHRPTVRAALRELVALEKARGTLSQWGLSEYRGRGQGTVALFHGLPGTGKTSTAEAIAYEVGRSARIIDSTQLISKWVGEGARNIRELFREAEGRDQVLVFDEADALFAGRTSVATSTDRYANMETSVLLQEIERYQGVVILTTNLKENIDSAFLRRIGFVIEFSTPDRAERAALWRLHLPDKLPVSADVDVEELAARFAFTGSAIRSTVRKAAARAAMRSGADRVVTMQDLVGVAAMEERTPGAQRVVGFVAA